jgi:hypothetical protein
MLTLKAWWLLYVYTVCLNILNSDIEYIRELNLATVKLKTVQVTKLPL